MPLRGTTNHENTRRTPELVRGCPQQVEDSVSSTQSIFEADTNQSAFHFLIKFDPLLFCHPTVTPL